MSPGNQQPSPSTDNQSEASNSMEPETQPAPTSNNPPQQETITTTQT